MWAVPARFHNAAIAAAADRNMQLFDIVIAAVSGNRNKQQVHDVCLRVDGLCIADR
jgi:phosphopantetheine adenylyltransferase